MKNQLDNMIMVPAVDFDKIKWKRKDGAYTSEILGKTYIIKKCLYGKTWESFVVENGTELMIWMDDITLEDAKRAVESHVKEFVLRLEDY